MSNLKQQHLEAIIEKATKKYHSDVGFYYSTSPESAATACEAITLEHMGKFAEWKAKDWAAMMEVYPDDSVIWRNKNTMESVSTLELINRYIIHK